MYTGTLEAYQGIPLLLDSMELPGRRVPPGPGRRHAGPGGRTAPHPVGSWAGGAGSRCSARQPADEIPYYLQAADVLVSPRTLGTNIPLKVYSYLASGVPVVATDLPTHTQTITPDIAVLARPEAAAFAAGIVRAAGPEGQALAGQGPRLLPQRTIRRNATGNWWPPPWPKPSRRGRRRLKRRAATRLTKKRRCANTKKRRQAMNFSARATSRTRTE